MLGYVNKDLPRHYIRGPDYSC